MGIPECEHDYDDTGYCLKCRNVDMSQSRYNKEKKVSDISKYTVVETKGWSHAHSNKLFTTKEEADFDWARHIFGTYVSRCTDYDEFSENEFIEHLPECDDLREALTILGKFMISYPK